MKLLNFELSSPHYAIELLGLGFVWDLHNAGKFLGIKITPSDNSATMTWRVTGHPASKYLGCNLVFRGLKRMVVSPRDKELPLTEDDCVSGISKIIPNHQGNADSRINPQLDEGERFSLLFGFQSRRSIEIGAESVELVGLTATDTT